MTCVNCFHSCVCHSYDLKNDVTMCKQFVSYDKILTGPALEVVMDNCAKVHEHNKELVMELRSIELQHQDLEREVKLLRIIKQTLEMQSGMKFDI